MQISAAKENILKKIRKALTQTTPLPFPASEGTSESTLYQVDGASGLHCPGSLFRSPLCRPEDCQMVRVRPEMHRAHVRGRSNDMGESHCWKRLARCRRISPGYIFYVGCKGARGKQRASSLVT